MSKSKRGFDRASAAEDLMALPSTKWLRRTWQTTLADPPVANSAVAVATKARKRMHPCFDPNLGLNALARAVLLRNVLKTEIRRDYKEASSDASWHIGIFNQSHALELFSERALSADPQGWLHMDGDNTATLFDLNWRTRLCEGFSGPQHVFGLNDWFESRYRERLTGGRMTARLLFETRFLGANAIDNYIRFLLHGIYVPSANNTLSPHLPYSDIELERDPDRRKKLQLLLATVTNGDNGGRPIVTVSCEDNPTAGSRLATTLVANLGELSHSACYIPLAKLGQMGQLNDHGYRSIVEAIYRFVTGESTLACSDQEHGEAELALMVRAVRSHLVTVATVFVFDGFAPGLSAFPALISFIRDEPIDRVLRLLQHPDTGDWMSQGSANLAAFRQTYFVVVGSTTVRRWMEMHRQLTVDLQFTLRDQNDVLSRTHMTKLRQDLISSMRLLKQQDDQRAIAWADNECRLNALSFLTRKYSLPGGTSPEAIERACFERYWEDLKSWQRLFLRALALSETGLRWSTSLQIFEAYARLGREAGATNAERPTGESVGAEEFKKFIDDACSVATSAPMLFEYGDGREADSYDIFDFPSQAISRLTDGHPWIMARRQKKERWLQTVDYCDVSFKRLVRAATSPNEAIIIRRILAELCFQNYRVRLLHSRTARRIDRRASRHLAEALLHGVMSVESPLRGVKHPPVLPSFTQGEIPAEPKAAFSFLYSAIFTEIFCDGDPTSIARVHGNGELQLEMLLLMSGATAATGPERALVQPHLSVRAPLWWDESRTPDALRHLVAIASSARRASRVEVLAAALACIEDIHKRSPLEGIDLLAFRKLSVDHANLAYDSRWVQRRSGVEHREQVLRAIVGCARKQAPNGEVDPVVQSVLTVLRRLKRDVRRHVREHLASQLSPQVIDAMVNNAGNDIAKLVPLRKIPKEALTVLTRMAWLENAAADRDQRHGLGLQAFERNMSAMALYWLGKALALRLRKESAAANPRVGLRATEGYVRTVIKLRKFLAAQDAGPHVQLGGDTQEVRSNDKQDGRW